MSSNGLQESDRPKIFKASTRAITLEIISPVASWQAHRIDEQSADQYGLLSTRPVRCGGSTCLLCGSFQRMARNVVLCIDRQKREWYLYLTERNVKAFAEYETLANLTISIRKTGPATNSPIEIIVTGRNHHRQRDIGALCEQWDQPALRGGVALTVAV